MKLQPYVVATQRGYAYGLCTSEGVRYLERCNHAGRHTPKEINTAYQQASRAASNLAYEWKRYPKRIRNKDGFGPMPGNIYTE